MSEQNKGARAPRRGPFGGHGPGGPRGMMPGEKAKDCLLYTSRCV